MLMFILNNGEELLNDSKLGWNLDTKEGITETLLEVGYYELFTKEKGWQRIYRKDVKEIVTI